ncbi:MAG: hypothetical protein ACXABM_01670 [Candidatus Thorarchaeota archaeon]
MILPGFQTADKVQRTMFKTGIPPLDSLLEGGYETGLVYLFYGHEQLHNDLLRSVVHAQLPISKGGFSSPSIMIDSSNMIDVVKLRDNAFQYGLEPESVMDAIYISRAFNASQTFDLVINHLDEFIERIPARMMILLGLVDLFIKEGLNNEKARQMTHMAARISAFTMKHNLVTLISTREQPRYAKQPPVGKTLASSAQVHILVEQTPMRIIYSLMKHPSLKSKAESIPRSGSAFGVTLPLEYFLEDDSTT